MCASSGENSIVLCTSCTPAGNADLSTSNFKGLIRDNGLRTFSKAYTPSFSGLFVSEMITILSPDPETEALEMPSVVTGARDGFCGNRRALALTTHSPLIFKRFFQGV